MKSPRVILSLIYGALAIGCSSCARSPYVLDIAAMDFGGQPYSARIFVGPRLIPAEELPQAYREELMQSFAWSASMRGEFPNTCFIERGVSRDGEEEIRFGLASLDLHRRAVSGPLRQYPDSTLALEANLTRQSAVNGSIQLTGGLVNFICDDDGSCEIESSSPPITDSISGTYADIEDVAECFGELMSIESGKP